MLLEKAKILTDNFSIPSMQPESYANIAHAYYLAGLIQKRDQYIDLSIKTLERESPDMRGQKDGNLSDYDIAYVFANYILMQRTNLLTGRWAKLSSNQQLVIICAVLDETNIDKNSKLKKTLLSMINDPLATMGTSPEGGTFFAAYALGRFGDFNKLKSICEKTLDSRDKVNFLLNAAEGALHSHNNVAMNCLKEANSYTDFSWPDWYGRRFVNCSLRIHLPELIVLFLTTRSTRDEPVYYRQLMEYHLNHNQLKSAMKDFLKITNPGDSILSVIKIESYCSTHNVAMPFDCHNWIKKITSSPLTIFYWHRKFILFRSDKEGTWNDHLSRAM